MGKIGKRDLRRWRGLKSLVHDAIDATSELVELGHESTARNVTGVTDRLPPLRTPARVVDGVRRLGTRGVLGTIKLVNRTVEAVSDVALDAVERRLDDEPGVVDALPMRSDTTSSGAWIADAALGLVNAAVGDHLGARANGLDLDMAFRIGDRYVALDRETIEAQLDPPSKKVALFVHGLGTTEWSWCLEAEAYHGDPSISFGVLMARDLGYTPVFLRYNTGRRVSQSGRRLAELLERFVEAYPVEIDDLTILGHSMGGLVARSACHYGVEAGYAWPARVRRVFYLGTPHQGAPLAKLGHAMTDMLDTVDLPGTKIVARILANRSDGIKDLSLGSVVDEDWLSASPDVASDAPLLPHASHFFVSATITEDPGHAVGRLIGDLLVRVPSADGPRQRETHFAIETRRYGGVMHHQLQNHPAVYAQILSACTRTQAGIELGLLGHIHDGPRSFSGDGHVAPPRRG